MARHTKHFERSMEKLKKLIHSLGAQVEESVERSIRSLTQRDVRLGKQVINGDDKIDQSEVELEEECLKVMALYQPVANDLRWVVSILKINNDLERIGDLAVNIAERAIHLAKQEEIPITLEFTEMSQTVLDMLRYSLDALINLDDDWARKVCVMDDRVDELNRKMYDHFESWLRENPLAVNNHINLLSASRYLERIADHATNICEDIIYMVSGKIVRHRKEAMYYPENGNNGENKKTKKIKES